MPGGSPMDGIVDSYDDMTPRPVISYDQTNNALAFDNPVQTTEGIASSESETLESNSPTLFKQSVQVEFNANLSDFVPMPLPSDPTSLTVPAINSIGTVQATDLMIAKDCVIKLYPDISEIHIYGVIIVDVNITNNNLQDQLNLKAPLYNPTCSGTVGVLSREMCNLANVDNTSGLNKPISSATQTALSNI